MKNGIGEELFSWEYLGALLARRSDEEQAIFIKAFLKECRSWGTSLQVEGQLCSVNHRLTREEKDTLSMLSYTPEVP